MNGMQNPAIDRIYAGIGNEEPFYRLVEKFYDGVSTDTLLRPIYPDDLTDSKRHLALFLIQRTGGAGTYSQERGHPRMRQRHFPFRVGRAERDAWITHMTAALASVPEFGPHKEVLGTFFSEFATFLINQDG